MSDKAPPEGDEPAPRILKRPLPADLRPVLSIESARAYRQELKSYWATQHNEARQLPAYAKRLLIMADIQIKTGVRPQDMAGADALFDGPNTVGVFSFRNQTIYDPAARTDGEVKSDFSMTLDHEIGHALDFIGGMFRASDKQGFFQHRISDSHRFAKAYAKDLAELSKNVPPRWDYDLGHFLPKAQGGNHSNARSARVEAFAEAWMNTQHAPVGDKETNRAQQFQRLFPRLMGAVQSFDRELKSIEKANPAAEDFKRSAGDYFKSLTTERRSWYCHTLPTSPWCQF